MNISPEKVKDSDAWSMGKNLVNLGNLKECMSLTPDEGTNKSQNPVYIKTGN